LTADSEDRTQMPICRHADGALKHLRRLFGAMLDAGIDHECL